MAKAKRSAAQKAATARMVAANRAKRAGASKGSKRSKAKRSKGLARAHSHGSHDGMALLPFTAKNTQANLRRLALGVAAVAHHSAKTREHVKSLEEGLIRKGVLSSRFSY